MKRREFIALIGGVAAWPVTTGAQPSLPVIGFLSLLSRDESAERIQAFNRGLSESGYTDGTNVRIDFQFANGDYKKIQPLVAGLIQRRVSVIVANTNAAALAAKAATREIPIVFYIGSDPVRLGLVNSLNTPESNLTGVFIVTADIVERKRVELLHQAIPMASKLAVLINPGQPASAHVIEDTTVAAHSLGLEAQIIHATNQNDLEGVFDQYNEAQAQALLISPDLSFFSWSKELAALSLRHGVPAIGQWREFVSAGGLMSYGSSFTDSFRQVGIYTGRILHGERPSDLPVQQTTKVDLVVNLKTAKALGVSFPLSLLGRADEVIE